MTERLLLLSDNAVHREALTHLLGGLDYQVLALSPTGIEENTLPRCTLAVLDMPTVKLGPAISVLKVRCPAPKLLVLVPFDVQGVEMRLRHMGADDVLALPVTRPRLEMTLINLHRIYALENGAKAAAPARRRGQ